MAGLYGSGNLLGAVLDDDGAYTSLLDFGNCVKFEPKADSEVKQRMSKRRDTYGQVLDTVAVGKPHTLDIELDSLTAAHKQNLALAFLGNMVTLNEASGTVVAEAVTVVYDQWVELANRSVSAVVITGSVEGTDFEVNPRLGMLLAKSTGNLVDGSAQTVDYSHTGVTGTRIEAAAKPQQRLFLIFDGLDRTTGKNIQVTVDDYLATPNGGINFLDDDFSTLSLSGTMSTVAGKTHPYTVDLLD